jgi:trans-aconitate methyltransferase
MTAAPKENWGSGDAYDMYVGRWSRKVAPEFLSWLAIPNDLVWAEVGCGTGALAEAILANCDPRTISGIDKSEGFIAEAKRKITDSRARFEVGDATAMHWDSATFDVTVSALTLNFVPDQEKMAREMVRVTKPNGTVAAYVWDYAGGMQMICHFWDAAIEVSPNDAKLKQGERFPLCQPAPLQELFERIGLRAVSVRAIDVPTVFRNFDDYWTPFLGKQGAAPTYLASVSDDVRERIREVLRARLTPHDAGPIELTARGWAVKGTV